MVHADDTRSRDASRRGFLRASGAIALTAALPGLARGSNSRYGIVGRTAPELTLEYWIDKDGKPTQFDLASARGNWVFLKCFQSWCPGCHSHGFPALQKLTGALVDNPRVSIAAIQTTFEGFSTNTADKIRKIQLQYKLPIPMGHDAGDPQGDHLPTTMRNYRTGGTPWMILIDPGGKVIFNDYSVRVDKLIEFLTEQTRG